MGRGERRGRRGGAWTLLVCADLPASQSPVVIPSRRIAVKTQRSNATNFPHPLLSNATHNANKQTNNSGGRAQRRPPLTGPTPGRPAGPWRRWRPAPSTLLKPKPRKSRPSRPPPCRPRRPRRWRRAAGRRAREGGRRWRGPTWRRQSSCSRLCRLLLSGAHRR